MLVTLYNIVEPKMKLLRTFIIFISEENDTKFLLSVVNCNLKDSTCGRNPQINKIGSCDVLFTSNNLISSPLSPRCLYSIPWVGHIPKHLSHKGMLRTPVRVIPILLYTTGQLGECCSFNTKPNLVNPTSPKTPQSNRRCLTVFSPCCPHFLQVSSSARVHTLCMCFSR